MKVKELMATDVCTCAPSATLDDVVALMKEHDCGSIPVVDSGEKKLVGVVTDRDVCLKAHEEKKALVDIGVSAAMTAKPVTCRPDDDVETAEKALMGSQVRRLPVVDDDGRVVGVLSLANIARAARTGKADVPAEEVGATLSAISQP